MPTCIRCVTPPLTRRHIVGRLGWHTADTGCPIGPGTWAAACAATDVATTAAQLVLDGEDAAYALCRPPGHHAFSDLAGGFCFLNNSAVAAAQLRLKHERVAILDVDVHHGNGTQGIFYERADVLTVSIHADPAFFYPFVWGYAHERGAGPGLGANLNIPLPKGTGDDDYIKAIGEAEKTIRAFAPGALVIALGLDASEHDPLAGLAVTTDGFRRIGAAIARFGLPTVFVQEGGYLSDILGANLTAALGGFEEAVSPQVDGRRRAAARICVPASARGCGTMSCGPISTLARGRPRLRARCKEKRSRCSMLCGLYWLRSGAPGRGRLRNAMRPIIRPRHSSSTLSQRSR